MCDTGPEKHTRKSLTVKAYLEVAFVTGVAVNGMEASAEPDITVGQRGS
jgi:uncharacterized protein YqfA (UPF0365 family)